MTPFTQLTTAAARQPGAEPLPGYTLIEPLGRGGFGEVWKCEAPGGLHKAIKFIPGGGEECRRELSAFERIKAIRHPYLLSLERVELNGFELLMVMELADCQFLDRMLQCQKAGLPGIPREELIGYLREVAEALDTIGTRHGLQHLDVKPQNLFLVSGHAKVGDYGLVRSTERVAETQGNRGFTPRYTAPEVLQGGLDPRSDQYSLALVYVELLTGTFPYSGTTGPQLILQHVTAAPNLGAVPESDRAAVARALSKDPVARFPSCMAFVRALPWLPGERPSGQFRAILPQPATAIAPNLPVTPVPAPEAPHPESPRKPDQTMIVRGPARRQSGPMRRTRIEDTPPPPDQYSHLRPVMSVQILLDKSATPPPQSDFTPAAFVSAVVQVASAFGEMQTDNSAAVEDYQRRFLCTLPTPMIPLKLAVVAERWGLATQKPDHARIVLVRESSPGELRKGERPELPGRLEVAVRLPEQHAAHITVTGVLTGHANSEFGRKCREDLPTILDEIRSLLQNLDERRAHPRYPVSFPVRIFPLYADGDVGPPVSGRCEDVSLGGVRISTDAPIRTERMFVEFQEIASVAGLAVYARQLRTLPTASGQGTITVCRFRTSPK